MKSLLRNLLTKYASKLLVDVLRDKAKKTDNKLDDKLVDAVDAALEGKDYDDIVASTKKEAKRAKAKVTAVKTAVKELKNTK